jgi:hypothetical protein
LGGDSSEKLKRFPIEVNKKFTNIMELPFQGANYSKLIIYIANLLKASALHFNPNFVKILNKS